MSGTSADILTHIGQGAVAFSAYSAFSALLFGKSVAIGVGHGEKTNGDSLCSLSSNPSPERIDESVLRESPLEMSILPLPETAIVLE
jgi:hypothetical protein